MLRAPAAGMGDGPWGPCFSPGPTSSIKHRSERTCPQVSGDGWPWSQATPYEDTAGAAEGYSLTWQCALPQHLCPAPPGVGSRAPAIDASPQNMTNTLAWRCPLGKGQGPLRPGACASARCFTVSINHRGGFWAHPTSNSARGPVCDRAGLACPP